MVIYLISCIDSSSLFLKWAHSHGIWEILNILIILPSVVIGLILYLYRKNRVRNLNFFIQRERDQSNYPLRVYIEIRNYTGVSVVISSPYFKYKEIRPDPNARGDIPSHEYEIKFPDRNNNLSEVEFFLRHKEHVSTWIPVDPTHTDAEIEQAIIGKTTGSIFCICTWIKEKPVSHKLYRKI